MRLESAALTVQEFINTLDFNRIFCIQFPRAYCDCEIPKHRLYVSQSMRRLWLRQKITRSLDEYQRKETSALIRQRHHSIGECIKIFFSHNKAKWPEMEHICYEIFQSGQATRQQNCTINSTDNAVIVAIVLKLP